MIDIQKMLKNHEQRQNMCTGTFTKPLNEYKQRQFKNIRNYGRN